MKKIIWLLISALTIHCLGQDTTKAKQGKIYGDVFLNANHNFDNSVTSFRLNRLHLGYLYNISENYYFNGMFESALEDYAPIPDSAGGEYNNITNLFEFCLGFNFNNLSGKFGLIGTELNQKQEQLWQHRYVDKVFADKYGYAPTNDFGFLIKYQPIDLVNFDLSVTNGEGHKSLQADSTFRYALGATVNLSQSLSFRIYSDLVNYSSKTQGNVIAILGYSNNKISCGAEWNAQYNSFGIDGFNRSGLSAYASSQISKTIQLFGRYDYVNSNKPNNADERWNIDNDGSLIIAGAQHQLHEKILLALNYRGWQPAASGSDLNSFLFLDLGVVF